MRAPLTRIRGDEPLYIHSATAPPFVLKPDLLISVPPTLATANLGGESVLLDPTTGTYFGLNDVGTRIFELAQEPKTVSEIEQTLLDEYDVDPSRLRKDIGDFISELLKRGLLNGE